MLNFLEKSFNKVLESEDFLTLCSLLHPILSKLHRACTRGLLGKLCDDSDASNALKIIHFFARNQNLAEVRLKHGNILFYVIYLIRNYNVFVINTMDTKNFF